MQTWGQRTATRLRAACCCGMAQQQGHCRSEILRSRRSVAALLKLPYPCHTQKTPWGRGFTPRFTRDPLPATAAAAPGSTRRRRRLPAFYSTQQPHPAPSHASASPGAAAAANANAARTAVLTRPYRLGISNHWHATSSAGGTHGPSASAGRATAGSAGKHGVGGVNYNSCCLGAAHGAISVRRAAATARHAVRSRAGAPPDRHGCRLDCRVINCAVGAGLERGSRLVC